MSPATQQPTHLVVPLRRCDDCELNLGTAPGVMLQAAFACPMFGRPRIGVESRCAAFVPKDGAAAESSIRSSLHRRTRLLRRVATIAEALHSAASLCPDHDHELKARLRTARTACAQLVAHVRRRQGGAL